MSADAAFNPRPDTYRLVLSKHGRHPDVTDAFSKEDADYLAKKFEAAGFTVERQVIRHKPLPNCLRPFDEQSGVAA